MNTNQNQGWLVEKTIRETLIDSGLTPGTPEYKKAYDALKWRRKTPEQREAKYRAITAARQKRRSVDPVYAEKMRLQWRKKKKRDRKKRGEQINEYQRQYYQKNRASRVERIKKRRHERDPSIGLATLLHRIKRGDSSPAELAEFARAATDKLNSLGSLESRKRIHSGRKSRGHDGKTE